ncbi:MAG TPA: isopentenyl transferase family protein, partial [Saprospiraceae bacterium]|nr:isopentenyl transferase family protein [Saprospiraceae bacterium]
MGKNKKLIVIVGPTASGKTTLAIQKAKEYQTEIVSADSRQIYKELNIGVARPSNEELDLVHHHLIANTSIHEPYDVSKFESQALDAIKGIFAQNDVAILVGGTGLYINAVLYGLDPIPLVDDSILKTLNTEWETNKSVLLEELKRYDPNFYNEVDIHNSRRVL